LAFAADRGVAVEAEFTGTSSPEPYLAAGVEVVSVQCLALKQFAASHPKPAIRRQAVAAITEAVAFARALGARHLITIGDYLGPANALNQPPARAADLWLDTLEACQAMLEQQPGAPRVLLEPLSRRRARHFQVPADVLAVLDRLTRSDLFGLALDTGHLLDQLPSSPADPEAALSAQIETCAGRCNELQLRGAASTLPHRDWPFAKWFALLSPILEVVTLEHRCPPDAADTDALIEVLGRALRQRPGLG
jgi:hypothetical protein